MKWLHLVHTGKNRSTHSGARGLAWPILGGWGPSDPSSNLGGPTSSSQIDNLITEIESMATLKKDHV